MRYLGGKARLAHAIAAAIHAEVGDAKIWEPFCGSGSVTAALALTQRGVFATDIHPALPAMFNALIAGWEPPEAVSKDEHTAARDLPDTDPRKAFIGFGCSYGGDYFAGYCAVDTSPRRPRPRDYVPAKVAADSLARKRAAFHGRDVVFAALDFLAVSPHSTAVHIYADPPYAHTTGYKATARFDHALFWRRCQQWTAHGVRVFVSELACPVPHRVIWSKERDNYVDARRRRVVDSLYEVWPIARAAPPRRRRAPRAAPTAQLALVG